MESQESRLVSMLRGRVDRTIVEILCEIQHVAYYQFDEVEKNWKKGDIEGPLILVKRNQEPHFYIVILNKLNFKNFYEPVSLETQFEQKSPQLLYIRDTGKVFGIWTPNSEGLELLNKKIEEIKHIDSQSRMLKNLLDIKVEETSSRLDSKFPEKIPEDYFEHKPVQPNISPLESTGKVLKPSFFQNGLQFEEEGQADSGKERLREAIIALAHSDEFLDLVLQGLRSKGF